MLYKKTRVGFKTVIIITSISMALLIGSLNIFKSKQIIDKQSNNELSLLTQNIGEKFNVYFKISEISLDAYTKFIEATFSYKELKRVLKNTDISKYSEDKIPYVSSYLNNVLSPVTLSFSRKAKGVMSSYFIFEPTLLVHKKCLGLWYVDKEGNKNFEITDNGLWETMFPATNSSLAWFYQPKLQRKAVWSKPYIDEDINIDMITYSKPVYVDKQFIGVTGFDLSIDNIRKYINKFEMYKNGYAYLLDKDFDFVFYKKEKLKQNLKKTNPSLYKSIKEQLKLYSNGLIKVNENGIKKIYSFIRLENGFIFMIEVPESEIYKQTNTLAGLFISSLILAILLSMIIAIRSDRAMKKTNDYLLHREKLTSIGTLSAGIAHEINNPIAFVLCNIDTFNRYIQKLKTFINSNNELIENLKSDSEVANEQIESLDNLKTDLKINYILEDIDNLIIETKDGVLRVQQIVKNLKNFSRDDISDEKSLENLNLIVKDALFLIKNQIPESITIETHFVDLPELKCNKNQISQVLMNIIINAIHAIEAKACAEQGHITISTSFDNKYLTCEIKDNGTGIEEHLLSKIFDSFFTTKSIGKGTGLGLSIVHNIITKKHKGDLLVNSIKGKGSSFIVKLPR